MVAFEVWLQWEISHVYLMFDIGNTVCEFKVGLCDFIVRLAWSVQQDALWVCGFSHLSYCAVERSQDSGMLQTLIHGVVSCGRGML